MSTFQVQSEIQYDATLTQSPTPKYCLALAEGDFALRFIFRAVNPVLARVKAKFHPLLSRPYSAKLTANQQDRVVRFPTMKLPKQPIGGIFFPDRFEVSIGGSKYKSRLPMLELQTRDKFFKYIVTQQFECLGFETKWLSRYNPMFPDISAIFKPEPPPAGEVFDVQCITQDKYDSKKFYADLGKFKSEKNRWKPKFTKLLIVPFYPDFTSDLLKKLPEVRESFSILPYPTLLQIVAQVKRGIIDTNRVYGLLRQQGMIRISKRTSIDTSPPRTLSISYYFEYSG